MTPYYEHGGITIYHGDCREVLPQIECVDVVLTDPPYDAQTHAGARTLAKRSGAIEASNAIEMGFAPLPTVDFTANLWEACRRWSVVFCSVEMLGAYRLAAGDAWVRGGFWRRPDGMPQATGDRPGQPGEGVAIMHRAGKKRWSRGGNHAYWECGVERDCRVHPTQKPERLMEMLVSDFSERGELVLDPFMGSGTTLAAAKRLGRKAIGIELEEKYCEVAARRLQQEALPLEVA